MSSKTMNKPKREHKGKLIYHSLDESRSRVGDNPPTIIERGITHSDERLICKYYEKVKGNITKITISSSGSGGDYTYSIKKGTESTETSTHKKTELLSKIKKDDRLDFIVKYMKDSKQLSRAKTSTKSKTKSKASTKAKTSVAKAKPKKRSLKKKL